ncbi:MAG: zinc-binding dehydrogenase [bacterium]|nr:zinc-binding dehydrogenase [bacterium]
MKAITVQGSDGIEGLKYGEVPTPEPGPGEARVRLRASGINHTDIYQCTPGMVQHPKPHTMGADGAGVIEAAGDGVSLKEGDEVIINPNLGDPTRPGFGIVGAGCEGTHAECIVLAAANLRPKPARMSFEDAAAFPLALCTAYRQVVTRAEVGPGETVLIHGIGGGVNLFGLQLAVISGARVIVTSSEPRKLELARAFGAEIGINYREENVAEAVKAATGGRGADVVIDNVGTATFPLSIECLAQNGRIAFVGGSSGQIVDGINLRVLFFKQASLLGSTMARPEEFEAAMSLAESGRIRAHIDRTFPLSRYQEAIRYVDEGKQLGKVIITREA